MKILTFDIEEWFHILDNNSTKKESDWLKYEIRIHQNVDRILYLLEKNNQKASFFIVGWIAEKYPEVVKKISDYGYEIGSHTYYHQLMYEQKRNEVKLDLKKSIDILQQLTGKKVTSFRAPGFSITEKNKWVFEELINNGIKNDCSIFPAGRAHGGFPSYKNAIPSLICLNGVILKEFPINTVPFLGQKIIFSGGGYFRLTPYSLIKYFTNHSEYVMTYFHPRDFDFLQPVIKELSIFRKFKSYVGLKTSLKKLEIWLNDYNFTDLRNADKNIDWSNAPKIKI